MRGKQEEKVPGIGEKGISRRNFLKGSGLAAGAAIVASSALLASGCTDDDRTTGSNGSRVSTKGGSSTDFDVFETDVLVLGAGMGGNFAAMQAYKDGATVTMVDKGPFQFTGSTGYNWDAGVGTPATVTPSPDNPAGQFEGVGNWVDPLANQKASVKAVEWIGSSFETWNKPLLFNRLGNTSMWREKDGNLLGGDNLGIFTRHVPEYLDKHTNVNVVDHTMITGLLVSGGSCAGAVGFHVPTGRYRVFFAKAAIIANGGSTQIYGWSGAGALSINSPDNTGDVGMAAFRQGCSLINTEFFNYDLISLQPPSIGGSLCAGIGADSVSCKLVCDKDGNFFFDKDEDIGIMYRPITTTVSEIILAGKGSENDCVYMDLSLPGADALNSQRYRRNEALWEKMFGIDVTQPGHMVEVGNEAFESLGSPAIDENAMTQIPGLFNVRGIGNTLHLIGCHYFAAYAGHCAASYASTNEGGTHDLSDVEAELARLERILNVEGTKRPYEIRHAIQHVVYDALHIGSNAGDLTSAIAEIKRIKEEDLPQMVVPNKTKCYNTDWRQAIENHNLIDFAEAALQATLMREESRGWFFRQDFPEQDDGNWLANIYVSYNGGEFRYEKRPVIE